MQYSTLKQGNKTVQEYIQEWEKLTVICNVHDDEELRVGKFLAGLREEIRGKLINTPYLTIHTAGLMAIDIEKHMGKAATSYDRTTKTYTSKSTSTTATPERDIQLNLSKPNTLKMVAPSKDVVCFKCNGRGHYKKDCPNARAFTMREWDEIRQDTRPKKILVSRNGQEEEIYPPKLSDDDGTFIIDENGNRHGFEGDTEEEEEEDLERILPEKEQYSFSIKRSLHTTPGSKNSDQRENTFQTKCKVQGRVCDLIIDGGSESNCVSKQLVNELNLETKPHPHPYKIKWLNNKSSEFVRKQCLVNLTSGTYTDKVLCDMLDMDACHILLGRPWQYDRRTIHDSYTNTYTFRHSGKRKELVLLPPHRTVPSKTTKAPIRLINKKARIKEDRREEQTFLLINKKVK